MGRLEEELAAVGVVSALSADAQGVYDAAVALAESVDNIALNRDALSEANLVVSEIRSGVEAASTSAGANQAALGVAKPDVPGIEMSPSWIGCGTNSRVCQ